ncbi:MAG: hypothetical protein ACKVPX_02285 [Myxococcaceae bacterium]
MMRPDVALEGVLRRAMGRAGIVQGWNHVCRKKGCTHKELHADAALRRCPSHKAKLWPKPQVRPIRFHDLRHTTASLLIQAGANPAAVQRILRLQRRRAKKLGVRGGHSGAVTFVQRFGSALQLTPHFRARRPPRSDGRPLSVYFRALILW